MKNLSTDQTLGKPLVEDLKGFRTVRIGRFPYRLAYAVKNRPEPVVVVYIIDHSSKVYSEMSRIQCVQFLKVLGFQIQVPDHVAGGHQVGSSRF